MDDILKKNILADLGIDKLPEKDQEEALLMIGRIIFQAVLLRVMDELGATEKTKFEKLLSSEKDQDKILNFLKENVPNLEQIAQEEIAKFKSESSGLMSQINK